MPKITQLPTDLVPTSEDLVPFVDISAGRTEAVTIGNLTQTLAGTVISPDKPPVPFAGQRWIDIDTGSEYWWTGEEWVELGSSLLGVGPPGPQGIPGTGRSGFTYVQDTMPVPALLGETWFNSSTNNGGTTFTAVNDGVKLVWVQN